MIGSRPDAAREAVEVIVGILAGGLGTRLAEQTDVRPKPMVEVGAKPLLWHLMKIYSAQGFSEFMVALGYRGDVIKDFFLGYRNRASDLTVDLATGDVEVGGDPHPDDWRVHLLETGQATLTGGRVKRLLEASGERMMLTYGDAVANVDLHRLLEFHESHGRLATVTAVRPPARFGELRFEGDKVIDFEEKPQASEGWINGGFFVLEAEVARYIEGDHTIFERDPMERLAAEGQLMAYRHDQFWQCMDTLRDVRLLEDLWQAGDPPWRVWEE